MGAALELLPRFDADYWKPEFALLWAETDLLAASLACSFVMASLRVLIRTPRPRKNFTSVIAEFETLLDGPEEPHLINS